LKHFSTLYKESYSFSLYLSNILLLLLEYAENLSVCNNTEY